MKIDSKKYPILNALLKAKSEYTSYRKNGGKEDEITFYHKKLDSYKFNNDSYEHSRLTYLDRYSSLRNTVIEMDRPIVFSKQIQDRAFDGVSEGTLAEYIKVLPSSKRKEVFDEVLQDTITNKSSNGVILNGDIYCFYSISSIGGSGYTKLQPEGGSGTAISLCIASGNTIHDTEEIRVEFYADNTYKVLKETAEGYKPTKISDLLCLPILKLIAFKAYAPIETKVLGAKTGKRTTLNGEKYVSDFDMDVEVIDSKWFTTLVKSEGFGVKGHFRLQPKKKDGEWTKELIWINDYQKSGYTAPARKLKQDI